jgi:hypothetical protein
MSPGLGIPMAGLLSCFRREAAVGSHLVIESRPGGTECR